jgi:polar amino acid transport system substrate-binding protein
MTLTERHSMIINKRLIAPLVAAAVGTLLLAGCSSSGGTSPSASTAPDGSAVVTGGSDGTTTFTIAADSDLAAKAKAIVTDGTLELATAASSPPYGWFADGDVLRGSDIDLGYAIAAKLGLKANYNALDFAGIIPAISTGRYDFSIASMGDTPEREKTVDFVDYSTDSNSIVTTKGNPSNITGIDSLCGLKVSSVEGSVLLGLLEEQNKKCSTPIDITIFKDNATALLQVQNNRADATMYQTGIALYLIKTDEAAKNLEVIDSEEYGKGYNAIAFSKDNSALRDLVRDALTALAADGVYDSIQDSWGLSANNVDEFTINDGLKYNQPS